MYQCKICCCSKSDSELHFLVQCRHEACVDCLRQWIVHVEATGNPGLPGCPFCRVSLQDREMKQILGRSYQPAGSSTTNEPATSFVQQVDDELTRQWMNQHTRPCQHCGAFVEKESGCDKMECLCGYRFCYRCGAQAARCHCSPANHVFWDNVLGRNALHAAPPLMTVVNNDNGNDRLDNDLIINTTGRQRWERQQPRVDTTDLREHLERRRQVEQVRRERILKRIQASPDFLIQGLASGKWLFASSDVRQNLRMLNQWVQAEVDDGSLRQRNTRRLQQLQNKHITVNMHPVLVSGLWLWSRHNSFKILQEGLEASEKTFKRYYMQVSAKREQERHDVPGGPWLFSSDTV